MKWQQWNVKAPLRKEKNRIKGTGCHILGCSTMICPVVQSQTISSVKKVWSKCDNDEQVTTYSPLIREDTQVIDRASTGAGKCTGTWEETKERREEEKKQKDGGKKYWKWKESLKKEEENHIDTISWKRKSGIVPFVHPRQVNFFCCCWRVTEKSNLSLSKLTHVSFGYIGTLTVCVKLCLYTEWSFFLAKCGTEGVGQLPYPCPAHQRHRIGRVLKVKFCLSLEYWTQPPLNGWKLFEINDRSPSWN